MSTAKSMANSYLNGKRTTNVVSSSKLSGGNSSRAFKSSTSNLSGTGNNNNVIGSSRIKATSMTNLLANNNNSNEHRTIQRPISRNALDSIHNGMNAKYAQVQSKVYLQNIKPSQSNTLTSNKTKSTNADNRRFVGGVRGTPTSSNQLSVKVPSDRTQLLTKLKTLQEELEHKEEEKENFKQELEREKADKVEQVQQLKQELEEKLAEHDKQHEEYHQKLLEAYELADQNRRAADSVLSESRQRDEESRKRIEELESQLAELKEFVSMKEEMSGKMYELREQIRDERERYEEQLKSLHQVFENEKLRSRQTNNYFKRAKGSLQSSESINKLANCRHCQSTESQLHGGRRPTQQEEDDDIYGSKLSTRMQDTARNAWKASKHFASSVITGGVGLSACRKRQTMAPAKEEHTSVVRVCAGNAAAASAQQADHLIRMDENNKLTIVTKFNDANSDECHGPNSANLTASSGSERSRCESSSSGRGTASEPGSATASQNGEEPEPVAAPVLVEQLAAASNCAPSQIANQSAILITCDKNNNNTEKKSHKRKASSVFKPASKMFTGSQVSLNKLRYFFTGSASNKANISTAPPPNIEQHLEDSRLRCMELNRQAKASESEKLASEEEEVGSKVNIESSSATLNHHVADKQAVVVVKVGQGLAGEQLAVGS